MTPADDTLNDLADASNAFDVIVHKLIIAQLSPLLDKLTEDEAEQAEVLRDALTATEKPNGHIAELETELAEMRSKAEDFRSRINNSLLPAADRVMARSLVPFYQAEAEALLQKLDQARQDIRVYDEAVSKARHDLMITQRAKTNAAEGILDPFRSPYGQATKAYGFYRDAHLVEIIMVAGETDSRWDSAVAMLEKLCLASGYRTDEISKRESMLEKRSWDDFRAEKLAEIPVPTGKDVASATTEVMTRHMEDSRHHDYIDDRRGLQLPPRNESVDLAGRPELRWSRE